ncbi:MAG: permease-like cell division protein FtsX [Zoogloeaceae bacterium]|jgi:cell division transport system permease protein|nr:permease-like cell division protein FtsX [Zoogloeaceae bacterium]
MKTWLRQHRVAFSRALVRLWRAPLNTLLSLLVIGVAMTLPAAGDLFLENVQSLGKNAHQGQQLSLFMDIEAPADVTRETRKRLAERLPGQWRFVSRQEALEQMQSSDGMAEIFASLPHNPLPDAFIIEPAQATPEDLERMRADLAQLPGVAHAQLDSAWIERFHAFLALGRRIVDLLALVFAAGLIAVTFNTIRLQVLAQADEIEVARFIGATDAFIRRPFCYSGILQGGLGGLMAGILLMAGVSLLEESAARLSALYGSHFVLKGPSLARFLLLPAVGAALGWLGAQLSVSLALRQMETTPQ